MAAAAATASGSSFDGVNTCAPLIENGQFPPERFLFIIIFFCLGFLVNVSSFFLFYFCVDRATDRVRPAGRRKSNAIGRVLQSRRAATLLIGSRSNEASDIQENGGVLQSRRGATLLIGRSSRKRNKGRPIRARPGKSIAPNRYRWAKGNENIKKNIAVDSMPFFNEHVEAFHRQYLNMISNIFISFWPSSSMYGKETQ